MSSVPFTEEDLHELYMWVDEIPISRPKRNIARDFSDGCCVAEVVKFFFPRLVELHNYVPTMSKKKKIDNWNTLNLRVFRKLSFEVPPEEVEDIVSAVPGAIERFLRALRTKIAQIKSRREELGSSLERDFQPPVRSASSVAQQMTGSRPKSAVPADAEFDGNYEDAFVNTASKARSQDDASHTRQIIEEKDRTIVELRETVGILSEKIMKLEELVRVKDEKLNQYRTKFGRA